MIKFQAEKGYKLNMEIRFHVDKAILISLFKANQRTAFCNIFFSAAYLLK
jgi:hypothetical protein